MSDQSKLDKMNEHNNSISSIKLYYLSNTKNLDKLLSFLQSAKNIKCSQNNDHLINAEFKEYINRVDPALLFTILCENLVVDSEES